MNNLTNKLDLLEARLQTLIEGHIARLLPPQLSKDDLTHQLITAMQTSAQKRDDGRYFAPDIFFIQLHPQHISGLPAQDVLLKEIAALVHQAGEQAGFQFLSSPTINLLPEPDMDIEDIDIVARISQANLDETVAIDVGDEESDDATNIPPNAFLIVDGSQVFNLNETVINIGRRSENSLIIDDPRVSRHHAQLRATNGQYVIFDLDSTGGTFVNGRRITQSTLQPRDVILLAGVPLVYAQDDHIASDETQKYIPSKSLDDEQTTRGGGL